jgi:hypothetical protein
MPGEDHAKAAVGCFTLVVRSAGAKLFASTRKRSGWVGHGTKRYRRIDLTLDSGFDGAAVAAEDDPAAGGVAAEAADVPPRLLT